MEYENTNICKKCGGMCCKKSGCDYFVTDFKVINKDSLYNFLMEENVSIVAAIQIEKTKSGQK